MGEHNQPLAFGDSAKFLTDKLELRGTIVLGVFEDGRIGITTDGVNGREAQDALATGIYINMADVVRRSGEAS